MSQYLRGIKPELKLDQDPVIRPVKPPFYFSTYARDEWRRIMPTLIARRVICKADLAQVETYCEMTGLVRQITHERQLAGGLIDVKLFGVQNRAAQTARQLAATLGLDPVSRARLGTAAPDDDNDNPLAVRG